MLSAKAGEHTVLRVLDRLTHAANLLGSLLIVALVILIGTDVVARNLFDSPISGVPEIVALSIVAIVFLQAPETVRSGRMIRLDVTIRYLDRRAPNLARTLNTIYDVLAIMVMVAILGATFPLFMDSWARQDFVGAVGNFTAPLWPVKLTIMTGTILLAMQFGARIVRRLSGRGLKNVTT